MSGESDKSFKQIFSINSSYKMSFAASEEDTDKKISGGIINEIVEEVLDPPEESNEVNLPSIDFDKMSRNGVHIAPAPSLLNRNDQNRASQFIRRKVKMKQPIRSEVIPKVVEVPTTCFGTVEFRGASRRSKSKFIRLSNDTPSKVIYKLLVKYWKLEPPQLLISVTGGAKNFSLSPILKQNFVAGISKVASTPGAWVITGGTNCGVMKYVGEAMQGLSKPCIGIATWGVISKRDTLNPGTCDPYETSTKYKMLSENHFSYEVGSWLTEKGAYLDSNHTHFLLVDDGSENKFGVEIPVRGSLEQYIMAEAIPDEDGVRKVPSVLVVLEGGPGTLDTIHSAVSGENPVPVVIVKSSGRAADLVCYALTISKEIKIASIDGHHEGLMDAIGVYLPGMNMQKTKEVYNQVLSLLRYGSMFTISQVGTEVDLDDAILTALLNDHFTHRYRQLQLTLVWNRADLARARIMSSMLDWSEKDDPRELQWLMIMALAMNNVDFVELLMEYGVCLSSFLTNELMEFLYGFRSYDKSSPLRYEIRDHEYKSIPKYSENASIYKHLCSLDELVYPDNVMIPRYLIENIIRQLCRPLIRKGNETFLEPNSTNLLSFRNPFKELYIWAVLNNMKDMAVFFWTKGEEHIAKALLGAHLCNALSNRRSITQGDIETSLNESESIFKDGALQLLDHCYRQDEYKTRTLITCDLDQFDELNVMKLASRSSNIDFVSHYAVQGLLEDVWVGNLKMKQLSLIKILFSSLLVFPVVMKRYFQFRTEEEVFTLSNYEDDFMIVEDEEEYVTMKGSVKDFISRGTMTVKQKRARVERGQGTELSSCRKLVEFYLYSPIVKFVNHVVGYVLFLILFSYISMLNKEGQPPGGLECLLIVTVIAFFVAEIYQLTQMNAPSYYAMFTQWAHSGLNLFDAFVIIFYFVSLGCRLNPSPQIYKAGHVMYAIDCGLWIFRLLTVCFISPTLGPYLVMIKRMSKDLMIFLSVLIVVIIGYGVTSTSILAPFESAHINMIRNTLWQPYFNIYGELFVDRDPNSPTETRFGTKKTETYDETLVWLLLGVYLLFTNILLLNLLIAVFNNTYTIVQEKSSQIWAFTRYHLIMEYASRHALFPPFSLVGHTFHLVRYLLRKCRGVKTHSSTGLKTILSPEQKEYLLQFESKCMTNMCRSKYGGITKDVNAMTTEILEELDSIKSEMMRIKEKMYNKEEASEDFEEPITSPVGKTFATYIKRNSCTRQGK